MTTELPGDHSRDEIGDFLVSYVSWVVVLGAIAIVLWWSSASLSAFRYAGF